MIYNISRNITYTYIYEKIICGTVLLISTITSLYNNNENLTISFGEKQQ